VKRGRGSRSLLKGGASTLRLPLHDQELVGDFRNPGREYRPQGNPEEVRVRDFLIEELGGAVPDGVYDLAAG
jgi:hypothetical protein